MSYSGISIREAMERVNKRNGGWFLPEVQRQYVWGARHESEHYVCLLLDSLLKRYPIGGIVIWETTESVAFREFVGDYVPGKFAHLVDKGRWSEDKGLVYDGQQRLQTLFSVLGHRFNGRVLHYDVLFDETQEESDDTGFVFRDRNASEDPRYVSMIRLSGLKCDVKTKVALEDEAMPAAGQDVDAQIRVRENISRLWEVFVDINIKSIAYFPVRSDTSKQVNEVFRRLNTGGVALTEVELVLGEIKAVEQDYEQKLWALSEEIAKKSGGIEFSSAEILQYFHLLVKGTTRIDSDRITDADIKAFQKVLTDEKEPLIEIFSGYLYGLFKINSATIIPRSLAILPMAAYLTARKRAGKHWRIRSMPHDELSVLNQYFLLAQFCDWNTQTMVNAFTKEAMENGANGLPFPLPKVREIAIQKNRTGAITEHQFIGQPWLATKILMPKRTYVFHERKPQVDHIFPKDLDGGDDAYRETIDVLWNFQPLPADVNNYKRKRHPKEFLSSQDGKKYWHEYDFLPDLADPVWDEPAAFVAHRRQMMVKDLKGLYGITLVASN